MQAPLPSPAPPLQLCSKQQNGGPLSESLHLDFSMLLLVFVPPQWKNTGGSGKLPDKPELGCVCLKWVVNTVFITVYRPLKKKAVLKPCYTLSQMRQRSQGKTTESGGPWAQCLQSHRASFN